MIKPPRHITNDSPLRPVNNKQWDVPPTDYFGYTNDEERRTRRGLEDWEMLGNHLSNKNVPSINKWVSLTVCAAVITTIALYIFGLDIKPAGEQEWSIDTFKEEIFSVIFFFIFLYTSLVIRFILDSKIEEKKPAERKVITGVLLGVLTAIIIGVIQVFLGYLL